MVDGFLAEVEEVFTSFSEENVTIPQYLTTSKAAFMIITVKVHVWLIVKVLMH